jgi:hypothetical protein
MTRPLLRALGLPVVKPEADCYIVLGAVLILLPLLLAFLLPCYLVGRVWYWLAKHDPEG